MGGRGSGRLANQENKARRTNKFRIKVVLLELRSVYNLLEADMDQETKDDVSKTLSNCLEKLTKVHIYYSTRNRQKSNNASEETNV